MQRAEDIEEAKRAILDRNPSAFDCKIRGGKSMPLFGNGAVTQPANWHSVHTAQPIQQTLPRPQRFNKLGCKCRRSFCLKKVNSMIISLHNIHRVSRFFRTVLRVLSEPSALWLAL
mmetsp:Transcript_30179/g.72432  ORF Transcript_30179/g.72432 Transcript_30179/m.72432 type:complete len:116 (+) Transcript_30179:693-1040(+)